MADDWTVVPKGQRNAAKRRHGNHKQKTPPQNNNDPEEPRIDPEVVAAQLASCCQHLTRSQFFQHFQSILFWDSDGKDSDDDDDDKSHTKGNVEIVCYGVGNFAQPSHRHNNNNNNTTAVNMNFSGPLWQLALALELQKNVLQQQQQQQSIDTTIKTVYYDPLVTEIETTVLQDHYGIAVLSENERGIRSSSGDTVNINRKDAEANNDDDSTNNTTTIFFMPHCPKGLYENVLWANWNVLRQKPGAICIVGNSLVTYVERDTTASNNGNNTTDKSCLQLIQPFVQERLVSYTKRDVRDRPGYFEAAFNDTYVTTFVAKPQQKLQDGGDDNDDVNTWPARPLQPSENGQNEVL